MAKRKDTAPSRVKPALSEQQDAFLRLARDRWQAAETFEREQRQEMEKDLEFLNLQQWDTDDKNARVAQDKPTLVIDQIGEPYRQLCGQFRRAHPGIEVSPVDSGADVAIAEKYQGAIRHIEQAGGAKVAREECFKGMAGPGLGYYLLYTDYDYDDDHGPKSDPAAIFDQCIKYQPIENQFTVFRDPACPIHEPWKAQYAFVVEDIPTETFKQAFRESVATSKEAFDATGLTLPDWFPETSVRVANYYYVETTDLPAVALLQDGQTVPYSKDIPADQIVQVRTPKSRTVKLAKITAVEVLEGNDQKDAGREQPWPYIPIVPMYGEALTVKGKRYLRGIVRAARDPQRMYNYQNSELVYELALSPKSKVIMAEGQDEGHEDMWKQAPTKAFPALKYKPTTLAGQPVAPPQVAQFTDPGKIQALTIAIAQHKADLRSTTGWYDATDPNRKNADQSGRAILARKDSQAEGSINFLENASNAIRFEGMLLIGAIPKIYNRTGRAIRIAGLEDDTQSEVLQLGQSAIKTEDGQQVVFQWGAGRYDITVDVGASYGTRRQEAAATTLELMRVLPPPMAAAAAPLMVRNMDMPGGRELADRLDRTLPPEVRGEDAKADPQQMAGQLKQAMQMNQMLTEQLNQASQIIKGEQIKAQADAHAQAEDNRVKYAIEQLKASTATENTRAQILMKLADLDVKAGAMALQEETKRIIHGTQLAVDVEGMAMPEPMAPPTPEGMQPNA